VVLDFVVEVAAAKADVVKVAKIDERHANSVTIIVIEILAVFSEKRILGSMPHLPTESIIQEPFFSVSVKNTRIRHLNA
jgi:hypothetical protein